MESSTSLFAFVNTPEMNSENDAVLYSTLDHDKLQTQMENINLCVCVIVGTGCLSLFVPSKALIHCVILFIMGISVPFCIS